MSNDKPTLTLRSDEERRAIQEARYNSVEHWQAEVRKYERFRDYDPVSGERKWGQQLRDAQQELARCRALGLTK